MTRTLFVLLLTCLTFTNVEGQCTLAVRQVGWTTDTIPKVIVYDAQDQKPIRINDSTIQFDVPPTRSECLFVCLDYKKRWFTRVWIDSTILHKELIVDYKKKTATIKNGNEMDILLEKDLQLNEMTQKKEKDSLDEGYIKTHTDEYFSLWFLRTE